MKNKLLLISILSSMLYACDVTVNPEQKENKQEAPKVSVEMAKVIKIQGLLVFVESEPMKEYESLGTVTSEDYVDQMKESKKDKKVFKAILDMGKKTFQNLDYKEKMEMMLEKVKKEYPEAVGAIFQDKLNKCNAIKFK